MSGDDQSRLVPRASAVEALTQIRALCDEAEVPSHDWHGPAYVRVSEVRAVLDAVPVDATPPHGIDRDALKRELKFWVTPNFIDRAADRILALVRPVVGVTLSREEAEAMQAALAVSLETEPWSEPIASTLRTLAARLEASS